MIFPSAIIKTPVATLMNFHSILSSEKTLTLIQNKCRNNFLDENDQDECYLFIINNLEADNYKKLSKFSQKSSIHTYLTTLVNNLVIDFRRKKYGRRRFPAMIKQLGEWAQAVYKYVCWQKFSYADAYDFLVVENLFNGTWEDFELDIDVIRRAPCVQNPKFVSGNDIGSNPLENAPAKELNPLDALVDSFDREKKKTAVQVIQAITRNMPQEDRLLIKLVYGSDHKIPQASKVLGISAQQARRRLKTILVNIKEKLLEKGMR